MAAALKLIAGGCYAGPMARVSKLARTAAFGGSLDSAFALLPSDEAAARAAFARAAAGAELRGEPALQKLCAAGTLLAISIEFADFRGLDDALARFRDGPDVDTYADPLQRARIDAATLILPSLTTPSEREGAEGEAAAARLHAFLLGAARERSTLSADELVLLGKVLVDALGQRNDFVRIGRLVAVVQEHLQRGEVSPVWEARWWLLMLLHHDWVGEAEAARAARERADALITRHGLLSFRFALDCIQMTKVLVEDDLVEADRLSDELEALMPQVRAGILPHGLRAQARVLMRRGRYREAIAKLTLLLGICEDVEVPLRDRAAYEVLRAHCLVAIGETSRALELMAAQRPHNTGAQLAMLEAITAAMRAVQGLQLERSDRRERVADAMRACAAIGYDRFLMALPQWASRLAEAALDDGVEVEFVRATIRRQRLQPSDPAREDWPWRLQIHALGELRLLRDGEPLRTAGKAQRKPLELLALLAAHPAGPIGIEAVVDQLWPSLEANAPRASFDMALSRLRKLLDVPDAIRVADGSVGLDPALAWTDVAAFEQAWDRLADSTTPALAERAIALYRDRLLGSEEATGLVRTARERLAMKFARLVEDSGARLEAEGQWQQAIVLYERGLARDTLAEPLYRALMRAHLRLDERAEALRTFRRCRELLLAVLGAEPSAQTRELADRARAQG